MIDFGLTPQEFRERFLEKSCYARKSALREPPFNWAHLDEVLHQVEPSSQTLQLFQEGLVPEDAYTEPAFELGLRRRRLNKSRFYALLTGGATLVINRLETLSQQVRHLCAQVSRFAGQQATGNGYVAFGGDGTFGKHWDTHDVFVLQLIGRKRWQVYPPTFPFPLSMHTSRNLGHECPKTPVADCTLEPGDLLYVPRGWWHHATPLQEGSFHLSVGTYGPSLLDYLMWACGRFGSLEATARRGLSSASLADIPAVMQALEAAIANPGTLREFQRDLVERERPTSPFDVELFAGETRRALPDTARVSLNVSVVPDCELSELSVNGVRMRLDQTTRPIFKALASRPSIDLATLYALLAPMPRDSVHATVLDLARHDIATIDR